MKNYFKKFSIMSLFIFLFLCAIGICNSNKAFAEEYLITPTNMTDSSSPSPFRADASSIDYRYKVQPWEAFNGTSVDAYDTWLSQSGESSNVWLSIDIGTRKIPSSYSFSTWNDSEMTAAPKDWNFEGSNDGVNWTILDKRINISGWNRGEEKKFNISNNSSSYSRFRINVLQNNGRSDVAIDNFKIYSDSSYDLEKNLSLNKYTDNLQVGQTDNLVVTTIPAAIDVTWKSSDSLIATVDSNGKVTGIKEGQAAITATTADGAIATCTVTVTNKSGTSGGNTTPTNPTDNTGGTSTGTDETSTIVNIAHAKGDNTNNAGGEVSIIFHGTADTTLSVVKTADVKDVWVGDKFTYTIVVTNTGSKTAKAVVVNDNAPNHIQFIPGGITTTQGTVDSTSTPSNIVVNVGDIPPSGTVTIKVPVTVVL